MGIQQCCIACPANGGPELCEVDDMQVGTQITRSGTCIGIKVLCRNWGLSH
ncbi:hypothetical protein B7P43_G04639 [Cryptotermes secundus]|uniref:Uncharacterized protein n=1 Tax=Cryptotermes secundus TaxID=105785 RepID=A0A2J7QZC3_9NEOP|nr:hypothetical protein B7P43_G04639 [Cryptotermes secundus]